MRIYIYYSQSKVYEYSFQENQYISVLKSLCAMISEYNCEKKLSLLGFGAKQSRNGKASHCFPLSEESVYVYGIKVRSTKTYMSRGMRLPTI